jgi:hypothetical protein
LPAGVLAAAALGTLTKYLRLDDASIFIAVGGLGDSWDFYFGQFASRVLGMYALFGPAQLVLRVVPMSADAFVVLSHVLHFAMPLVLWLALRAIEPHRLFSRLYLAIGAHRPMLATSSTAGSPASLTEATARVER